LRKFKNHLTPTLSKGEGEESNQPLIVILKFYEYN